VLKRTGGLTLLELLTTLAIVSVLFGFAIPQFTIINERSRATVTMNWLIGAIQFARYSAINQRILVTLCPSRTGDSCGGKWHQGVIAFTDHNKDHKINGGDQLLKRFYYPLKGGTVKWRSFRNRQYLQMTSEGLTNYQNGNFTYCATNQDPRFSRQIVLNVSGRFRASRDSNGDGRVEDRRGKPLRC